MSRRPAAVKVNAPKKRPAFSVAKKVLRRPSLATQTCKRPKVVAGILADVAYQKGAVIFKEHPLVATQARRSEDEHHIQQPLFCATCCSPVGPLEVALALAAGRASRAELLEFVRSSGGQRDNLLKWVDFAGKIALLPAPATLTKTWTTSENIHTYPSIDHVSDKCQIWTEGLGCFCSKECFLSCKERGRHTILSSAEIEAWRDLFNYVASTTHDGVLLMAVELITRVTPCRLDTTPELVKQRLEPLLCTIGCASGASESHGVPKGVIVKTHNLLVKAMLQAAHLSSSSVVSDCNALRKQLHTLIPRFLFGEVVQVLNVHSWALSGVSIPSALGRYCEAMCKSDVSRLEQTKMARVVEPIVKALCAQQDALDSNVDSDETNEPPGDSVDAPLAGSSIGRGIFPLLSPQDAQKRTSPIVVPRLFTEDDIQRVKSLSQQLSANEHSKYANSSQWRTRYLHAKGLFQLEAADLMNKLVDVAFQVDRNTQGWGLLSASADHASVRTRCIEHHLVAVGGALPDPTHFDGGSLITIDIMLADPGHDFQGGAFCTMELDGRSVEHSFAKGDALVFVSHRPHFVCPVTKGLRETLIMELWEGEERHCDHRCAQPWGLCSFGANEIVFPPLVRPLGENELTAALDVISKEAVRAFASTAFEGFAFFPRLARIAEQRRLARRRVKHVSSNVEVIFDDVEPIATLRATRDIQAGEQLRMPTYDEESVGETDGEEDYE